MKYAVVESGGKQYIARPGEMIEVDHLSLDVGEAVKFANVLMTVDGTSIHIGQPVVKGAVVEGKVAGQIKGRKIVVFKYKPKIRYRRKQGHRQRYTQVSIQKITLPKAASEKAEGEPEAAAAAAPKAAPRKRTRASTAKKTTAKPAAKKPAAKKKPATKAGSQTTKKTSSKPASKKSTTSKKTSSKKDETK